MLKKLLKKVLSVMVIGTGVVALKETGLIMPSFSIIVLGVISLILSCDIERHAYYNSSNPVSVDDEKEDEEFEEYQFYKHITKK